MTNRIPQHTSQQSPAFGLVGWLEKPRVPLPLKDVECQFHVCGELVNVQIDQIFHQNSAHALDCIYTFPLPAGAAVYRCEMHVNGRMIRARVEELQRARELVHEQKAAGRRTALVESERENLFTLSLGNLQPGDVVVIRLGYFQTLTRLADWTSLRIPFCPGVRYIPGQRLLRALRGKGVVDDTDQVPDASRISPPRIDALHPDAAYLSVDGVVENPAGIVCDVSSPSHPVLVKDGDGRFSVLLADGAAVPNGDFALRWTENWGDQAQGAAWVLRDGAESYALVRLQAPRVAMPEQHAPQDFYFLVDRSGSMKGLKWEKAVQAFRAFLQQLGTQDRAWATFFNKQWHDFAEQPLTALELGADAGLQLLEQLGAEGGTEMLPALKHALDVVGRHSGRREAMLVLITDGQVGNEASILDCLRAHPDLRVHAFGIDTAVNDALLTHVAAQQRGSCCLLQPTDDIVGAVTRLGPRLRHPVVTGIAAGDGWELPGATVPDLHAEQCLSLVLRRSGNSATEVVFRGRLADGREETFRIAMVASAEPAIRLWWVKNRIQHCLGKGQPDHALALAKQHNLICDGAAFIAWDEAEQVVIAEREIYQPCFGLDAMLHRPMNDLPLCEEHTEVVFLNRRSEDIGLRTFPAPYRHRRADGTHTMGAAMQRLQAILAQRPHVDGERFQCLFGQRLGECYAAFHESYTFSWLVQGGELVGLLMAWVVDGGADAQQRLASLEALIRTLEWEAPDPEAGLVLARRWAEKAMADCDDYRTRTLALLDTLARRLQDNPRT